jgi:hypothetical protein
MRWQKGDLFYYNSTDMTVIGQINGYDGTWYFYEIILYKYPREDRNKGKFHDDSLMSEYSKRVENLEELKAKCV